MDKTVIWNTFILAGGYLLLFGLGEFLYHVCRIKVEITRKIVHAGTGLLALLFPVMLHSHWPVLILCSAFAVILLVSLRFGLLRSINAIDRRSVGSLAYPVAVYGCYLAFQYSGYNAAFYYLPVLILAICDPIAGLVGKKWPIGPYSLLGARKTVLGSVLFFLSTFLLTGVYLLVVDEIGLDSSGWLIVFITSVLVTTAEAVSKDGYDNVSIPFTTIACLWLAQHLS